MQILLAEFQHTGECLSMTLSLQAHWISRKSRADFALTIEVCMNVRLHERIHIQYVTYFIVN